MSSEIRNSQRKTSGFAPGCQVPAVAGTARRSRSRVRRWPEDRAGRCRAAVPQGRGPADAGGTGRSGSVLEPDPDAEAAGAVFERGRRDLRAPDAAESGADR